MRHCSIKNVIIYSCVAALVVWTMGYVTFYRTFHWQSRVGPRSNSSLAELLRLQITRQKAPLEPESMQRWVIASFHMHTGLCNRMMNVVSCLAFAMVTGRRLWIDWESWPISRINEHEMMGIEGYDQLFSSELRGVAPSLKLREKAVNIDSSGYSLLRTHGFMRPMIFAHDLNTVFPYQVVKISRVDFWGALLLADYGQANFGMLFKALFTLKGEQPRPESCSWLLQRRTKWARIVPPSMGKFLQCARSHNSTSDFDGNVWLLTDEDLKEELPDGVQLVEPNISHVRGKGGDRTTLESMYRMSACKNAVLTTVSTFGSCVAALAGAKTQYEIFEDGRCQRHRFIDPIDRGTSWWETMEITVLLDEWAAYNYQKDSNVFSSGLWTEPLVRI